MDRRHNDPQTPHERARLLASDRLDGRLSVADAIWLDAHLRTCDDCRVVAEAYQDDRELLRSMPLPEPPRDLWARTSVALERERAARGVANLGRRGRRVRWEALAGVIAVLLVGVVVGRSLLLSDQSGVGLSTSSPGTAVGPGSSAAATPLIVPPGNVAWAAPGANGSYTVNVANVDAVCPQGPVTDPGCASLDAGAQAVLSLTSKPGSVVLDPQSEQAAVVESSASTTGGSIIVVPISRPAPTATPRPSASPSTPASPSAPTAAPSATSASATAGASSSPSTKPGGTPDSSPSASPAETPQPTATVQPSASPSASPVPTPTEAAAALAIINDVIVVGGDAAYSPNGEWLAFSARPSDGSHGPDVYVWRVGDPAAEPLTTDHGTVFSDWVDDWILVSRAIPSPIVSDSASPRPVRAEPVSLLLDPASGKQHGSTIPATWRPVVDPTGRWVAYWTGELAADGDGLTFVPDRGRMVIDRWDVVSDPGASASLDPQPLLDLGNAAVRDWEVRWDPTGRYLGVWAADPLSPALGRLSLLAINRSTGRVDSEPKQLLSDAPALAGFAIRDGRIVWATPPGQDGEGSRLLVLAWKGPDAGRTRSEPAPSQEDIIVVR
jgi:putative zinc finger protein